MRTALLSTIERTEGDEARAFLPLGGRKLIDWQLDLARELRCDRVICLAEGPSSDLDSFRDRVEKLGLEFQAIGGPLQLVGLISADQELVVIGDGVVIDRQFVREVSLDQRGVAVIPAKDGIAAGFERVDAQNAWGGIFIARGQIAEQLADMPADSDTISLLLRLALQAGTPLMQVDSDRLADGTVILATDSELVSKRERSLISRSAKGVSWFGPFTAMARILSRKLAGNWIVRGPEASFAFAIAGLLTALTLTFYSLQFWAMTALAVASFAGTLSASLFALRAKLFGTNVQGYFDLSFNILIDYSLIISLTFPFVDGFEQRLFLAVIMLGLWRVTAYHSSSKFAAFWQDRSLLIAILLLAIGLGEIMMAIQLLALIALGSCLFLDGRGKITQA